MFKKQNISFIIFIAAVMLGRPVYALADAPSEGRRLITLSEGIRIVLKDNRLIKVALPENEMALQNSFYTRSALLPQLNIFASKTYNQYAPAVKFGSQSVTTGDRNPFGAGIDLYQTLFDFGKDLSYYRASKEAYKAVKANTESVRRLAMLEFVVAYFNILETEKMIAVFEKEAESLASYLNDIQNLYEHGKAVKNDLLPAKVRLADVKQRLIAARNNKEQAIALLNNILALSLKEKTQVEDIRMEPSELPNMDYAWDTALSQRPEIIFYDEQIKSSVYTERAKAVENFPVIFADLSYDYQQNRYITHDKNGSAELGVKMDFYDGGAARAELMRERARQKQLKEQKEKVSEDIKLEVENSYYDLKDACEKVIVAKEALEQADENVRFYRIKYNAGSANQTDVLAAIAMQTKAQTDYCNADYELKRSYATMMYSMGIDLSLIYERMESKNGERTKQ